MKRKLDIGKYGITARPEYLSGNEETFESRMKVVVKLEFECIGSFGERKVLKKTLN